MDRRPSTLRRDSEHFRRGGGPAVAISESADARQRLKGHAGRTMSAAAGEPRLCRLDRAVGVDAACPEECCPFWEPGGAVLEGRCVFERVDFGSDHEVARLLLGIRERLEGTARE
jgi:hypothetical protein